MWERAGHEGITDIENQNEALGGKSERNMKHRKV